MMGNIPVPHPVGDLRSSNFIPDEIVTAYSPPTILCASK